MRPVRRTKEGGEGTTNSAAIGSIFKVARGRRGGIEGFQMFLGVFRLYKNSEIFGKKKILVAFFGDLYYNNEKFEAVSIFSEEQKHGSL